jgi:outer membrane lipoprotein-sorting protein
MTKITLPVLILVLTVCTATAQTDKQAVSILDKFSSTATSAPSVKMRFLITTDDQLEGTRDTLSGSVILSKNSYRLDLPDNIIWFNGETSWSYLPAEKEVTITKPDRKDNSFQSRPASIFTMYKSGYKSRLVEERTNEYLIDLYPEDIKNDIIRVRLVIGKPSLNLKSLEYKRRDGITITLGVKEYNLKQAAEPGMFVFAPEKYKGVEIIDMR